MPEVFNYSSILATCQRLINKFGRTITLVELSVTRDAPTQPWLGSTDVRTTPVESVSTKAAFVEPDSLLRLGREVGVEGFTPRAEQIALLSLDRDISNFEEIIDSDASVWKIIRVSTLKPGLTTLMHYVEVKR